jgi:hypothetical protein
VDELLDAFRVLDADSVLERDEVLDHEAVLEVELLLEPDPLPEVDELSITVTSWPTLASELWPSGRASLLLSCPASLPPLVVPELDVATPSRVPPSAPVEPRVSPHAPTQAPPSVPRSTASRRAPVFDVITTTSESAFPPPEPHVRETALTGTSCRPAT